MEAPELVDLSALLRWELEIPRHLLAQGLGLFDIEAPPTTLPKHVHDRAFFCMLLDGELENDYGSERLAFQPSALIFHPAETVHTSLIGRRGARIFTVDASNDWIARAEAHGVMPRRPTALARQDLSSARRLLRELRQASPCSLLAVEGLVLELLAGAVRPERTVADDPAWLDSAHDLVRSEFAQPLTLTDIAARIGAEPARLSVAFRQRFGQSLGDFLRTLRVQRVCDALDTDQPLADIALAAGFADQAHCTRIFKLRIGVTPGAYRRALREKASRARRPTLRRAGGDRAAIVQSPTAAPRLSGSTAEPSGRRRAGARATPRDTSGSPSRSTHPA